MITPPFDMANAKWAHYKQFYIESGHFTQFVSGEFIITTTHPRPDARRMYEKFGVGLYWTKDYRCPKLYLGPDDEHHLPTAHLGSQQLLVDYSTKTAVRLERSKIPGIPRWLAYSATAYFPSEGQRAEVVCQIIDIVATMC